MSRKMRVLVDSQNNEIHAAIGCMLEDALAGDKNEEVV